MEPVDDTKYNNPEQIDPYEGKTYEERAALRALRRKLRAEGDGGSPSGLSRSASAKSLRRAPSSASKGLAQSASAAVFRSNYQASPRAQSLTERVPSSDRLKFTSPDSPVSAKVEERSEEDAESRRSSLIADSQGSSRRTSASESQDTSRRESLSPTRGIEAVSPVAFSPVAQARVEEAEEEEEVTDTRSFQREVRANPEGAVEPEPAPVRAEVADKFVSGDDDLSESVVETPRLSIDSSVCAVVNEICESSVSVEQRGGHAVAAEAQEESHSSQSVAVGGAQRRATHFEEGSTLHTPEDLEELVGAHPVLRSLPSAEGKERVGSPSTVVDAPKAESAEEHASPARVVESEHSHAPPQPVAVAVAEEQALDRTPEGASAPEPEVSEVSRKGSVVAQRRSSVPTLSGREVPVVVEEAAPALERKASVAQAVQAVSHERVTPSTSMGLEGVSAASSEEPTSYALDLSTLVRAAMAKFQSQVFEFNIMVAGETGLGKTTFIDAFFNLTRDRAGEPFGSTPSTVDIVAHTHTLDDGNARVNLTIVDTPGYGDKVNNSEATIQPILNYLDQQHNDYMNGQFAQLFGDGTKAIPKDGRVHCCILFLAPNGRGLKSHDLILLRKLCPRVNVIPVIAKADTLTRDELAYFRSELNKEFEREGLTVYNFNGGEDSVYTRSGSILAPLPTVPLAIAASNELQVLSNGRKVPGRKYRWGVVEVFNESHSDFAKLRRLLLGQHLQRLKDITHEVHYEAYRQVHRNRLALHFENKIKAKLKQRISAMRDDVSTNLAAVTTGLPTGTATASTASLAAPPPADARHSRGSSESTGLPATTSPQESPQRHRRQSSIAREAAAQQQQQAAAQAPKGGASPASERRNVHFNIPDDKKKSPDVSRRGVSGDQVRAAYEEGGDGSAVAAAIAAAHAGLDPASAAAAAAATIAEDFRGRTDTSTRAELAKAMLQQKYQTIGAMTKTGHHYNPLADRRKAMMDRRALANVGFGAPAPQEPGKSPPTTPRGGDEAEKERAPSPNSSSPSNASTYV